MAPLKCYTLVMQQKGRQASKTCNFYKKLNVFAFFKLLKCWNHCSLFQFIFFKIFICSLFQSCPLLAFIRNMQSKCSIKIQIFPFSCKQGWEWQALTSQWKKGFANFLQFPWNTNHIFSVIIINRFYNKTIFWSCF